MFLLLGVAVGNLMCRFDTVARGSTVTRQMSSHSPAHGRDAGTVSAELALQLLAEHLEDCMNLLECHAAETVGELLKCTPSLVVCSLKGQQIIDQFHFGMTKVANRTNPSSDFADLFISSGYRLRSFAEKNNEVLGVKLGQVVDGWVSESDCDKRLRAAAELAIQLRSDLQNDKAMTEDRLRVKQHGQGRLRKR